MYPLSRKQFDDLLKIRGFPCVSLYMPLDKSGADARQGAIRLRQIVKEIDDALHELTLRTPLIEQLLRPVEALYDDALFWEYQDRGLAFFINGDGLTIVQLSAPCAESVTIDDRFMILPLISQLGLDKIYYLLTLGLASPHLYRCTRYHLDEIEDAGMPDSLKAVVSSYSLEKQLQHHSGAGGAAGSVFHNAESAKDSEKDRIDEYFRQINVSLKKSMAQDDAPLVVACVDYLFPIFKSIFRDPRLINEHIAKAPDSLKKDQLLESGWKIARTVFDQPRSAALKTYQKLAGSERISQDISQILTAGLNGQIELLFLLREMKIWGKWDQAGGRIRQLSREPSRFGDPDLLNQAAMLTLGHGGQVFILDQSEMPLPAPNVAVLRF